MLLSHIVVTSRTVTETRSRLAKTAALAEALAAAGPDQVEIVAAYLAGAPRQRRTGLGWRSLAELPEPATSATLTVAEVDRSLELISGLSGPGSQSRRAAEVADLFGRATVEEQEYLRALIFENLRQGALDSLLLDAIARAADVPVAVVRRAAMFSAASGPVARAALAGGVAALEAFTLVPCRPVRPMLASSAPTIAEAAAKVGARASGGLHFPTLFATDRKLDGIRIQVHRAGEQILVFTRSLDEIADRLPEVVEAVAALDVDSVILDGEALAIGPDGRPRPFQETAARTASSADLGNLRANVALSPIFFDLLHLDGRDLIDETAATRFAALAALVPPEQIVARLVTSDVDEANEFFEATVAAGHEGVVLKSLTAPYDAGRRGTAWVKVKPRHTLDLVVVAVEWGSGRRVGKLSNIHLAARNEDGGFTMLGKTFKGMTDEILDWQTERFLALETGRTGHVVHVSPEQVVEIAFDGVQASSRYPGGIALRFARVLRYRDDKSAADADTLESVRALRL